MSVKLEIYNAINSSLTSNVTAIKTIKIFNTQYVENEVREKPIVLPAVFVEFTEMPWETKQQPSHFSSAASYSKTPEQQGVWRLSLHVIFDNLKDETDRFSEEDTIIDNVFKYTQGLTGTSFTSLKRVNEIQDTNHDRVKDWVMEYETGVTQCGLADDDKTKIAGDTIDPDVQGSLDIDNTTIRTGDGEE